MKGDGGSIIIIRNRYNDGYSGNIIRHSTSVKVKIKAEEHSITIPTCSYYTLSAPDRAITELSNFKRISVNKNVINFVVSFIYDNQAAIIAYWYVQNLDDKVKDAFTKYFSERVSSGRYSKGDVQPKIDKYLNADFDNVMDYIRKEIDDPLFDIVFEKPSNSGASGVATISHRSGRKKKGK